MDDLDYKPQTYLMCTCKRCQVVLPNNRVRSHNNFLQEILHTQDILSLYPLRWVHPQ